MLGNTDEGHSLGTVMVSTYHVQQLAEAVVVTLWTPEPVQHPRARLRAHPR